MSQLQQSHHRYHSSGSIPFSWENSPGVSKEHLSSSSTTETEPSPVSVHDADVKLRPPPGPEGSPRRPIKGRHSIHVPLPPCPFQPMADYRKDGDPFLAAYMECTKSKKSGKRETAAKSGWGLSMFSCKQGSDVREDGVVKKSSNIDKLKFHGGDNQKGFLLLEKSQSQRSTTAWRHQKKQSLVN